MQTGPSGRPADEAGDGPEMVNGSRARPWPAKSPRTWRPRSIVGLLVAVSRLYQGPRPSVVQYGGVWQGMDDEKQEDSP
jgi:hypothetical protein